jgi:hypothetical protein
MTKRRSNSTFFVFSLVLTLALLGPAFPFPQDFQIQKAKIFQDTYELITDSDLYCSFYLFEEGQTLPEMKIIGAERENEKSMMNDADTVYINKGSMDGLEMGQLFLVIGLGEKVGTYGLVTERLGRARVVRLEDNLAVARLEKTCGGVRVGDYLLPFQDEEGEIGKDLGFEYLDPGAGIKGQVIYVRDDTHIGAAGQWALIDLGRRHCVQIGDQLTVFKRARPDLPREAVGNVIIIDVRMRTATVKILSSRDSINIGDEVQLKTTR